MPRPRLPYLHRVKTRHGKFVWYVRPATGKRARIRIAADYGTSDFQAQYSAAVNGIEQSPRPKARSGTLKWLYDRYRESSDWKVLSEATRRQRENIFVHVMDTAGNERFTDITRKTIIDSRERRSDTPAQARNFLDAMRGLFRWALKFEHVSVDPTAGVKNPRREKGDGFLAWEMSDVRLYESHWQAGTKERLWMRLILYIGCRRGDAVLLGKQHLRAGAITFITEKGRKKQRIEVTRRIEPELAETLADGPCGDLAFICGDRGLPLTKESFGNMFKDACVAAGIQNKSAHGLRKLSATIWAERGATVHELMAMFGWLTVAMAELYTRAAQRKLLSHNAHDRFFGTPSEPAMDAPQNNVDAPEKSASKIN